MEHKQFVKTQIRAILKSMNFVSDNFLNKEKKAGKDFKKYFDIYQQLGLAWEFLGLQCGHWEGYKKTRDKSEVCRICGKVKGVQEEFVLLTRSGMKKFGIKSKPNSKRTFAMKKKAEIINDTIVFHGATLNVDVHNSYKSKLFDKDITIAPGRYIKLYEDDVECSIDEHLVHVKLHKADKKAGKKKYGGFPWEISRKNLNHFPVIFDFDEKYRMLGLTILR